MMRALGRLVSLTSVFTLLSACESPPETEDIALELANKARLELDDGYQALSQTSTRAWSLDKTGVVNTTTKTVTWNLVATQSASASNRLVAAGRVKVENKGNAPATLGNVVVNLQRKVAGVWTTVARDISDETYGDAATTAQIIQNGAVVTVAESPASGTLTLSTPGPIPANKTVNLDFTATFNNNALSLPTGAPVRIEVVITHGNANNGGGSAANVDIDGNGSIGPDETRVKTVSMRFSQKSVPAPTSTSTTVALSDTVADIKATGTVTFTNAVFTLGATTGTVTVSYAGGVDGGTIENCGHLTGTGVNLTDCDTQMIAPEFVWNTGDMITYGTGDWGTSGTTAANLLGLYFDDVYFPNLGQVEVGLPGAGYSIVFGGPDEIIAYLPASGTAGALTQDWINPVTTEAGGFGGDTLTLELNVSFNDAAYILGNLGVPFGDVTVCDVPGLDGLAVRDVLAVANTLLGGGSSTVTITEMAPLLDELNLAFGDGNVSLWARDHLVVGACPP